MYSRVCLNRNGYWGLLKGMTCFHHLKQVSVYLHVDRGPRLAGCSAHCLMRCVEYVQVMSSGCHILIIYLIIYLIIFIIRASVCTRRVPVAKLYPMLACLRMASDLWSSCLCLQRTSITSTHNHEKSLKWWTSLLFFCGAKTHMEFDLWTNLPSVLWQLSCFCFLSASVIRVCYHTWMGTC